MNIFEKKNSKKKFFFQIDLECFKTYFKPKKLISKKFPVENFFLGLNHFFDENGQKVENFEKNPKKNFLESIQNVSKRILNRKS